MSNVTPLVLGLAAGGLALWHFTKPAPRNARREACELLLDADGLVVDGEPVALEDAVARARVVGLADVRVAPEASATAYAALMAAFADAEVRVQTTSTRNAGATASTFTLVTYPQGVGGATKRTRWFRTDVPMTWQAVRDQLAVAGVLDPRAIAPGQPGYWKLITDARVFRARDAEPLPIRRGAARATPRYALAGGRVITRDGEPAVRLERVDLGDARYVLSPAETDALGARIVRLLNRRGRA